MVDNLIITLLAAFYLSGEMSPLREEVLFLPEFLKWLRIRMNSYQYHSINHLNATQTLVYSGILGL